MSKPHRFTTLIPLDADVHRHCLNIDLAIHNAVSVIEGLIDELDDVEQINGFAIAAQASAAMALLYVASQSLYPVHSFVINQLEGSVQ